ncbi:hypothetical protein EH222_14475 [candidate division KSB1 bacterium]|nr:MAG: hypothetical protein EH222_14475 [candidate division KSB1 bacterium]
MRKILQHGDILNSQVGDHFFGTLTAYVAGADADHYRFTSALPVQVLKWLAPVIESLLAPPASPEKEGSETIILAAQNTP